jgi:eukaryotic-like serine/threonine-protein kinase
MQHVDESLVRARKRIGTTVRGKWRIDALIGIGGMAAVYSATHRNSSRVALKVLRPELSVDEDIRARFLREGYVANAVDHPGTVRVLDDDVDDDGSVFLVMELLEGESLADRLDRVGGRMSVQETLLVGASALDVLVAAHSRGIVHRDLKPDNVFLTEQGQVKVLDFGIARVRELSSASSATRTGTMIGTPAYMPPEQALGHSREIDARTDLWAIGATIFRMITGRNVHPGETPNEMLIRAATLKAPSLNSVVSGASTPLVEFLETSLAFERERRWPDASAMLVELRRVYETLPREPLMLEPVTALVTASTAVGVSGESTTVAAHELLRPELARPRRDWREAVALGSAAGIIVVLVAVLLVRSAAIRGIAAEPPATRPVPSMTPAAAPSSVAIEPTSIASTDTSAVTPPGSASAPPKGPRLAPTASPPSPRKDWLNRRH